CFDITFISLISSVPAVITCSPFQVPISLLPSCRRSKKEAGGFRWSAFSAITVRYKNARTFILFGRSIYNFPSFIPTLVSTVNCWPFLNLVQGQASLLICNLNLPLRPGSVLLLLDQEPSNLSS